MDKTLVVQCLRVANQLWAIEGANPYSVRAHDQAAESIRQSPLSIAEILTLPPGGLYGVGKETLAMLRTLQTGGMDALLRRLNITIPIEAAQLLQLPGIGPKTAHTLVHEHNVNSIQDLAGLLDAGSIRIKGIGQSRIMRLRRDAAVFLERQHAIPIAIAWPLAQQLVRTISELPGVLLVSVTGKLRRFVVMPTSLELIAAVDNERALMDWTRSISQDAPSVNNVHHQSHRTILISLDVQGAAVPVSIHVTTRHCFTGLLLKTTGDEMHNEVLKKLLLQAKIQWNEDGTLITDDKVIALHEEKEVYELIGMPYLPPEVREGKGLLVDPANLVQLTNIKGDLHVHSNWSDGTQSIAEITQEAERLGYEYIAITDHSQSLSIAGGLTPEQLRAQRVEINAVQKQTPIKILHGIEVDIRADGSLDLPDESLLALDIVIASVHSAMHQTKQQMTQRLLRAIEHPAVNVIGHLNGKLIGRRAGYELDFPVLLHQAQKHGVMFELNANPNRLDIPEEQLRAVTSSDMYVPVNTDAHHPSEFRHMEYGIHLAWRGWVNHQSVLNTRPYDQLCGILQQHRTK